MSLVTRCPKCQSGFEVTADQLRLHDGLVRCGQCSHVFDGYACLQASLPTLTRKVSADDARSGSDLEPSEDLKSESRPGGPIGLRAESRSRSDPEPVLRTPPEQSVWRDAREPALSSMPVDPDTAHDLPERPVRVMGEARIRGEDPSSIGRREPEFMEDEQPASVWSRMVWGLFAIVLGLVLLVQLLVFFRNDLATTLPMTRPALEQLCRPLGCEVTYVRRIDRIVIIGSSLQQQSSTQEGVNSYLLRLTLQNRNDYPQLWPSLLLSLSDASGTVVVRKVIAPDQYLPAQLADRPFAARQEMALEVPLTVTGLSISGFELQKFFP